MKVVVFYISAIEDGYGCSAYGANAAYNTCQVASSNSDGPLIGFLPVTGRTAGIGLGVALCAALFVLVVVKRRAAKRVNTQGANQ